jgi:predicted phosphodiesterase
MGPPKENLTRRFRLIVIGDIHYPEHKDDADADVKDKTFPAELVSRVAKPRVTHVARELQKYSGDGTVILGDLTSRGNLKGYTDCVDYLAKLLHWDDKVKVPDEALHVVPGNHDIDRQLVAAGTQYEPLQQTLRNIGRDILPVSAPRKVRGANWPVAIWSLDSCVGCGTQRGLPEDIADALRKLPDPFDRQYEGLDTPAFDESHVDALVDGINVEPATVLPVVIFHHNLLPQHMPRIAPYTEVINGGYLRRRLLDLDRPVIVLHGHLHSTVLEYVARAGAGGVYCLGATKFVDGFDVLDIHFSGVGPLGFTVHRFRIGDDGQQNWTSEEVSFARRLHAVTGVGELARALYSVIADAYTTLTEIRNRYIDASKESPQKKTIATALEELRWAGLVEIADHQYGSETWRIRRIERV